VTVVQYTFTHKPYTEQHNETEYTERNIQSNKKLEIRAVTVFASYTLAFALHLRKKQGKTSVRVAEKCPDISMAIVQYTFTHKQYTEQHNEVEYTERNIRSTRKLLQQTSPGTFCFVMDTNSDFNSLFSSLIVKINV
jgi:hypothetical protein